MSLYFDYLFATFNVYVLVTLNVLRVLIERKKLFQYGFSESMTN